MEKTEKHIFFLDSKNKISCVIIVGNIAYYLRPEDSKLEFEKINKMSFKKYKEEFENHNGKKILTITVYSDNKEIILKDINSLKKCKEIEFDEKLKQILYIIKKNNIKKLILRFLLIQNIVLTSTALNNNSKFIKEVYAQELEQDYNENYLSLSDMSNILKMLREKGFDEKNFPYHLNENNIPMIGSFTMVTADTSKTPIGTIINTEFGPSIVCAHSNFLVTDNNKNYNLDSSNQELLESIVCAESDKTAEDALAITSVILNRCEDETWKNAFGEDPIKQITAPGQFNVFNNGAYKKYLNGNTPIEVQQAVEDALNGKRNCKYLTFRSNKSTKYSSNMCGPSSNRYL